MKHEALVWVPFTMINSSNSYCIKIPINNSKPIHVAKKYTESKKSYARRHENNFKQKSQPINWKYLEFYSWFKFKSSNARYSICTTQMKLCDFTQVCWLLKKFHLLSRAKIFQSLTIEHGTGGTQKRNQNIKGLRSKWEMF